MKGIWILAGIAILLSLLWWGTAPLEGFQAAGGAAPAAGGTGNVTAVTGAEVGENCKKSTDCKTMKCRIIDATSKLIREVKENEDGKCADANGILPGYRPPEETEEGRKAAAAAEEAKKAAEAAAELNAKVVDIGKSVSGIRKDIGTLSPLITDMQEKISNMSVQQIDLSTKFNQYITAHPMQPETAPDGKNLITAPGVARPVGSTSERPTYPAAVDVEPSTFEKYVGTLVKSVMAEQGKPVTEGFQLQEIVANVRNLQRRM